MSGRHLDRMVRKAQQMEKRVDDVRKELGKRVFGGEAQGLVEAMVNGDHEVLSIKISPDLLGGEDPERVEKLVLEALNEALGKSKTTIDLEMRRATKGFSVPGL